MEFREEDVLSALGESGSKGLKAQDIARHLRAGSKDLKRLRSLLYDMETAGTIVRGRRRRYRLPGEAGLIRGTVFGYGRKVAVLVARGEDGELSISEENLGGAGHGDTVLAKPVRAADGDREARVVKILERAASEVVGRVSKRGEANTVEIDKDHVRNKVTVDEVSGAGPGDFVLVRVPRWGDGRHRSRGKVVEVLGGPSEAGGELAGILKEFNLPLAFPGPVVEEAEAIPESIPVDETARRYDLSDLTLFTIDPADAKDFDDAISIEELGKGALRVGVHIADVSHYVAQGSRLDREAMARGRSVYLVDRVVPMLPARLSSDMASLKPGVPRLALSVFIDLDRQGRPGSYSIRESVIVSKACLTYEEAQRLIEKGAGWRAPKHFKQIAHALELADGLRRVLKADRIKRGAVELDTPEVDIVVDDSGNTVDVRPARRLGTHNLIEELMVLANETVARHMSYLGRDFIYRIHEVPDVKDMADLALFAGLFGHRFRWTKGTSPRALQALLEKVKGRPEHYIMSMFLLRSLKKALYSERNVGHFGLASKCYTHFTSPIRRYPDLVVHRLVKRYGLYMSAPEDKGGVQKFVRRAAEIASIREIEGDEAERASIKARVAGFMEERIGEEYWGIISGVKDFGFFVMLEENLVEGLVHVTKLGDDYYTRDATGTVLVGSRTGKCYRMGDRVRVRVVSVNRAAREVDFEVLGVEERSKGASVVPVGEVGKRRRRLEYAAESPSGRPRAREKSGSRKRPVRRPGSAERKKPGGREKPTGASRPSGRRKRKVGRVPARSGGGRRRR